MPGNDISSLASSDKAEAVNNDKKTQSKEEHESNCLPPSSASKKKQHALPPPVTRKTKIDSRLNAAVKLHPPTNRSSDLVPLSHEYDLLKKNLRALCASAKQYLAAREHMDKTRLEMSQKVATLADKSPLCGDVGAPSPGAKNSKEGSQQDKDSLVKIFHEISGVEKRKGVSFQDKIVDYVLEWEHTIAARVDVGLATTKELHDRLDHYRKKVASLRKKVENKETRAAAHGAPHRLTEKLERNEGKLDVAWKKHESAASELCNLMEEVTRCGWKDLYPLVKSLIQWEFLREAEENEIATRLASVEESLTRSFEKHVGDQEDRTSIVPVVNLSDTTGSHMEEEEEISTASHHSVGSLSDTPVGGGEEDEAPMTPTLGSRTGKMEGVENNTMSPTSVLAGTN